MREITSCDLVALVVFVELVAYMAEPSLLCVNCARPPPPHRRTWSRCTICVARNLPSTYYCGQECMNAHWPKHKAYHTEAKERAEWRREGTLLEEERSEAEEVARRAEETGSEYSKRLAPALALTAEGDYHAAAKAWRKMIKQWPEQPMPYRNLAVVLHQSCRYVESVQMYLKAMELYNDCTEGWADSAASAFDMLKTEDCDKMPKPEWWGDEALKALSARVVALAPDGHQPCNMRARVLCGDALNTANWNVGPRTAAEIKEAATWYRRTAMLLRTPSNKLRHEELASMCDAVADPLLAEEEADAAKARAAAKAEAAEALKVAEAKAAAAADELLAEEEQEKQAASTKAGKAKQSNKGKQGKGRR